MRAVISVLGKDTVGILAKVASKCAEHKANVIEVTQSVLQEMFVMVMMVEIDQLTVPLIQFVENMEQMGKDNCLKISVMHEELFQSMHRI